MGFLGKVFSKGEQQRSEQETEAPTCPHTSLVQRWDSLEEMGKPELARYVCDACGESFSYEEAQSFLEQVGSILER